MSRLKFSQRCAMYRKQTLRLQPNMYMVCRLGTLGKRV